MTKPKIIYRKSYEPKPSSTLPTAVAIFSLLFIPSMMLLNSQLEPKPSELALSIERANKEAEAYHAETQPVVLKPIIFKTPAILSKDKTQIITEKDLYNTYWSKTAVDVFEE